jgi:hypothetical protein
MRNYEFTPSPITEVAEPAPEVLASLPGMDLLRQVQQNTADIKQLLQWMRTHQANPQPAPSSPTTSSRT